MNSNQVGEQNKADILQKHIRLYFVAGIGIVGLVIAVVAMTPLLMELSKSARKELQSKSQINALLIEEYMAVMQGVAGQITSRTRARVLLEDLNGKKISLDDYQALSKPIMLDALGGTESLISIQRLDSANINVLSVGEALPEEFWVIPEDESAQIMHGPLSIDGELRMVIGTPILGRSGVRVGTDITMFELSLWQKIISGYKDLKDTGEIILGRPNEEGAEIFYSLRGAGYPGKLGFGHEHPITDALVKAAQGISGVETYRLAGVEVAIAFAPINRVDWGILVKMDSSELNADINKLLFQLAAVLACLIILGVMGMHWLLKPLGGRLIMRESELNRQIELKTEKLQKSNEALEKFTYAASHDLKSPLRVIDNAARWLQEDLEPHFSDENRINMDLLTSRIKRMEALLDALLVYGRVGRIENKLFQLETTAGGVLYDVLQQLKLPDSFSVSASAAFQSMPVMQMPFERVLNILLENAYRHHDREAGNITLDVREAAGSYVVSVKDDGPGIESRFHEKVFELFQTLQPKDKVEGSGMGLAIVSKILNVYGGSIEVKSDGRGSEFILHWPKISH